MTYTISCNPERERKRQEFVSSYGEPALVVTSDVPELPITVYRFAPKDNSGVWFTCTSGLSECLLAGRAPLPCWRTELYMLPTDEPVWRSDPSLNPGQDPVVQLIIMAAAAVVRFRRCMDTLVYLPTVQALLPGSELTSFLYVRDNEPAEQISYDNTSDGAPSYWTLVDFLTTPEVDFVQRHGVSQLIELFIQSNKLRQGTMYRPSLI